MKYRLALQAFPKDYCDNIHIENPTEEQIDEWYKIFEEHRKLVTKTSKPKTRKQIVKWLKNPYSASNVYKAAGNAVTVSVIDFILENIINILEEEIK